MICKLKYHGVLLLCLTLLACTYEPDRLDAVLAKGQLAIITRNAATAFYESREGFVGVEYEMAKSFADSLGVAARFYIRDDVKDIFSALTTGEGDLAAAGLTHTSARKTQFVFGPTYQMVQQQLVCRRNGKSPRTIADLSGLLIKVPAASSYAERLTTLKEDYPKLAWQEVNDIDTETLLEQVWQKKLDCTIADANIVAINRRYYPELSVRFDISEPEPLAWAMPLDAGRLHDRLEDWYEDYVESGKLDDLMHRYYGYIDQFDYVDARAFQRKARKVLPRYKKMFKDASRFYGISWTLLAAQAYQESHWRPNAKSPTGVRGMMMLTRTTAKELGIKSRLNVKASIMGGAYYLDKLRDRLPATVTEPDRTWLALAAYNVGMGHLWDARHLAKEMDKNPDSWQDLAEVLPLLSQKKYYVNLKHGYARGWEPVRYVQSIRDYQDMLEKITKENSL